MATQIPRIELQLNPSRLSTTLDRVVVATNEIVNFHFNALEGANLDKPAFTNTKFRLIGPEISAAERRSIHENWILAKGFQELLRAVRHSLEEAYIFAKLLTNIHRIESNMTLDKFLSPFRRKAAALRFPELLDSVNNMLDQKIEFSAAYISLQSARNCLEHRDGIVRKIETHGKETFNVHIPKTKIFYLRDGKEIELEPGHRVDSGDNRTEVDVFMKIEARKRSFALGERLAFTLFEFNDIAFACHFLGQQLSQKLPKQKVEIN